MKISNEDAFHWNTSLLGKMRLLLFEKITGTSGVYPSNKQAIQFIENLQDTNPTVAKLYGGILIAQRCAPISVDDLNINEDLELSLQRLNASPLAEPVFIEIAGITDTSVLAWIESEELADHSGLIYTVILLKDD